MKRHCLRTVFVVAIGLTAVAEERNKEEYLPGGPLAGINLPLFKPQHGEPDGYPGRIPDSNAPAPTARPKGPPWPEMELYPGAEEHWRAYYFKYLPQRSFFDRQSQLRNFTDLSRAPEGLRAPGRPDAPGL